MKYGFLVCFSRQIVGAGLKSRWKLTILQNVRYYENVYLYRIKKNLLIFKKVGATIMLEKLVYDTKKYWKYTKYAAKSELKSEVANSHLNWLWWVLEPLLLMLVYLFIAVVAFNSNLKYFPIYIFLGLTLWNTWSGLLKNSLKLLKRNKGIISKVYLPKLTLLFIRMLVSGFKMLISFGIIVVMMICWRVPLTWNIFYAIPLMLVLILLTFGMCTILMHYGVFVEDLSNVINVGLKLLFYMTGIFYSLEERVHGLLGNILLYGNPISFVIHSMRNAILYGKAVNVWIMLFWGIVGIILSVIGVKLIYKYENSYVKVL